MNNGNWRLAYDAARPIAIPANPPAVFDYADGRYAWSHSLFPDAWWRTITVLGDPVSDIADVEEGCIWPPSDVRVWAERRLGRGYKDLTIYCDRDNYPAVKQVMDGLDWHLFLATLDGTKPTEYDGMPLRAVQYTDRQGLYDMSIVYEPDWLNKP